MGKQEKCLQCEKNKNARRAQTKKEKEESLKNADQNIEMMKRKITKMREKNSNLKLQLEEKRPSGGFFNRSSILTTPLVKWTNKSISIKASPVKKALSMTLEKAPEPADISQIMAAEQEID